MRHIYSVHIRNLASPKLRVALEVAARVLRKRVPGRAAPRSLTQQKFCTHRWIPTVVWGNAATHN